MKSLKNELRRVGLTSKNKQHEKRSEKLSEKDLKDLMGVNRPTYKRGSGGALKQK